MRNTSVAAALATALLLSKATPTLAATHALGDLVNMSCSGAVCDVWSHSDTGAAVPLRLAFYAPQIVRWWLALDGNFSNIGAAADVIVGGSQPVTVALRDAGTYFEVTQTTSPPSPVVVARVQKSPTLLTLLADGQITVQESAPISWNGAATWQTLARDIAPFPAGLTAEHFFGGGMQHGRFAHRDATVTLGTDFNWDDNGHPNSVPWFISSAGYGVFRNTWAPGTYAFNSPVVTSHNESNRLDAFFMIAGPGPGSIKTLLGLYTQLTGPPFLPPLYGLYLGDSDCYHNDRHGNSTQVAVAVASLYEKYDMPRGWMLPNDGYGCGYGEVSLSLAMPPRSSDAS